MQRSSKIQKGPDCLPGRTMQHGQRQGHGAQARGSLNPAPSSVSLARDRNPDGTSGAPGPSPVEEDSRGRVDVPQQTHWHLSLPRCPNCPAAPSAPALARDGLAEHSQRPNPDPAIALQTLCDWKHASRAKINAPVKLLFGRDWPSPPEDLFCDNFNIHGSI